MTSFKFGIVKRPYQISVKKGFTILSGDKINYNENQLMNVLCEYQWSRSVGFPIYSNIFLSDYL